MAQQKIKKEQIFFLLNNDIICFRNHSLTIHKIKGWCSITHIVIIIGYEKYPTYFTIYWYIKTSQR